METMVIIAHMHFHLELFELRVTKAEDKSEVNLSITAAKMNTTTKETSTEYLQSEIIERWRSNQVLISVLNFAFRSTIIYHPAGMDHSVCYHSVVYHIAGA